ncbi:hypothetical protein WA026_023656, partial [Henosepilachna vigintioctopunctata]
PKRMENLEIKVHHHYIMTGNGSPEFYARHRIVGVRPTEISREAVGHTKTEFWHCAGLQTARADFL